jgi:hypothetical protein
MTTIGRYEIPEAIWSLQTPFIPKQTTRDGILHVTFIIYKKCIPSSRTFENY